MAIPQDDEYLNHSTVKTSRPMLSPDVLNGLRRLGLNQYEARAYLALATGGHSTAGEVSERADIPRPRSYDVLRSLQDRGFIALKPGRPVKYFASPLPEAVKTLKKQRESQLVEELARVEEIAKGLSSRIKSTPTPEFATEDRVWTLKGREAIYSKLAGMIAGAKQHILLSSDEEGILRKVRAHAKDLEKAKARGVKLHFIAPSSAEEVKKLASIHTSKKLPARLAVVDDHALLFLTDGNVHPDDDVALWIQAPNIADTLRQLTTEKR